MKTSSSWLAILVWALSSCIPLQGGKKTSFDSNHLPGLAATSSSSSSSSSSAVALYAIAVSANNNQSGTAGSALSSAFIAVVTDQNGAVVSGLTVDWSVASGGGSLSAASGTTNGSGLSSSTLTLGTTAGTNTVTATLRDYATSVTFTATGTAGAAATIAVSANNNQSGTAGAALASAFQAVVRDANSNVVSGVTVNWAIASGGGSLSSASNATNGSGISSSTLTLGTTAGANTVTATINGTATSVTFSATGVAGAASSIAVSAHNNQTGTAGSALASAFDAVVKDANNNVVSGVTVNWAVASGGGSLSSSSNATNASGVSSSTLTLGNTAGANTVTATINGTATSVTFSATGNPGAVSLSQSVITVSAATIVVGGTSTITLTAKDSLGNALTSGGLTVVFGSTGGTATATVGATSDPNNGSYTATFSGTGAGTAKTITATIGGSAVTSSAPTVTVNAVLSISPSSVSLTAFDASNVATTQTFTGSGGIAALSYSVVGTAMPGGSYGSVTSGGVYTAPADGGTLKVRVTDGTSNADSTVRVAYSRNSVTLSTASKTYIEVGNQTLSTGSLSMWVKTPSAVPLAGAEDQYIVSRVVSGSPSSGGEFRVMIPKTGQTGAGKFNYRLENSAGTAFNLYSDSAICDGAWHHIVVSFPTMSLWVDGAAISSGNGTNRSIGMDGTHATNAMSLNFGKNNVAPSGVHGYFDGKIDDTAFFNVVLSNAQVTELYNSGLSANLNNLSFSANLIHWWKMGDGDTSPTVSDVIGSWPGTLTNVAGGSLPTIGADSAQ